MISERCVLNDWLFMFHMFLLCLTDGEVKAELNQVITFIYILLKWFMYYHSHPFCMINIFPYTDAFWHQSCSRRLLLLNVFNCVQKLFVLSFIMRELLYFWQNVFKVVCCRFVVSENLSRILKICSWWLLNHQCLKMEYIWIIYHWIDLKTLQ